MTPQTNTIIDMLTKNSVSIKTETTMEFNGQILPLGEPHRISFVNSVSGRIGLSETVQNPYLKSILDIWGKEPTVIDTPSDTPEGGENNE